MSNIINSGLTNVKYALKGIQGEMQVLKNSTQSNIRNIKNQNSKLIKEVKYLKNSLAKSISKISILKNNKKRKTSKKR